jgi:thioredoxin-dependent peroxiredoxin
MKTRLWPLQMLMSLSVILASMLLASSAPALEVGEEAPDFTLPSTTGEMIRLSQFKGLKHVLIQFYTMDFNPACAANLTTRMVDHGTFEALHVQLLAISANNRFSQQMFAASLHLPFPLISDHPDLTVIQHYGVLKHLGEAHQPVARGAVFLVDKRGVIRGKWLRPPGEVFPNDELLEAAHALGE